MGQSFGLGRISGIRIGVNWSMLVIVAPADIRKALQRISGTSLYIEVQQWRRLAARWLRAGPSVWTTFSRKRLVKFAQALPRRRPDHGCQCNNN